MDRSQTKPDDIGDGRWENRSDPELMQGIRRGDPLAFDVLYARWNKPILHFFYHLCWEKSLAEDCMQEVFLRVLRGAKDYRPTGKFSTYLFQIAKHFWFNEREKALRRAKPFSGALVARQPDSHFGSPQVQDPTAGPRTRAMRDEMELRVQGAVRGLPEKYRMVFVLGTYEGMRYSEIGEILGIPEGTVKSRMSKAVELLHEKLKKYL